MSGEQLYRHLIITEYKLLSPLFILKLPLLGIVIKWEGKMVLRITTMEKHITVSMMTLCWIKERGHGWSGVMLTSVEKM